MRPSPARVEAPEPNAWLPILDVTGEIARTDLSGELELLVLEQGHDQLDRELEELTLEADASRFREELAARVDAFLARAPVAAAIPAPPLTRAVAGPPLGAPTVRATVGHPAPGGVPRTARVAARRARHRRRVVTGATIAGTALLVAGLAVARVPGTAASGDRLARGTRHVQDVAARVSAPERGAGAPPAPAPVLAPPAPTVRPSLPTPAAPVVASAPSTPARPAPPSLTPRVQSAGTATWYETAPGFGTCAHRTLRFGTIVTLTNVRTGATATCRVADRGPESWTGHVIDLAPDVFRRLAPLGQGVVSVVLGVTPDH